jgi:hypothetical protein
MASKLRSRFRRDKVLNLGKKIFSLLKSIEINCKPLGINNVLEASWFSHALYFQNVINPNWKIKSLWFGSIKKISNGISELIFFYKMKKK